MLMIALLVSASSCATVHKHCSVPTFQRMLEAREVCDDPHQNCDQADAAVECDFDL
jgi:hypothetical protein